MYVRQHPTMGPWVRRVEGKPSWVWKAAALAALITIGVPLLALAMAAMFVGIVVFVTLGVIAAVLNGIRNLFGGSRHRDMREERVNVRVVRQDQG